MKYCPQCNQTFTNDNSFCQLDGTTLIASESENKPTYSSETPTVVVPNFSMPTNESTVKKNSIPAWLYAVLFLLIGLVFIFGFLAFYDSKETVVTEKAVVNNNAQGQTNLSDKQENISIEKQNNLITDSLVRNLLNTWEAAQNGKNFQMYRSCYSQDFQGIKRTKNGSIKTMGLNSWLKDRNKMLANAKRLNIEIKNLRISISDNTAVAEFDQYYRSQNYSDWGPKVLKIKMLSDKVPKIYYEELKVSYPLN